MTKQLVDGLKSVKSVMVEEELVVEVVLAIVVSLILKHIQQLIPMVQLRRKVKQSVINIVNVVIVIGNPVMVVVAVIPMKVTILLIVEILVVVLLALVLLIVIVAKRVPVILEFF